MIDPSATDFGDITVIVYDVPPDATGTITPGGPSVTTSASAPGQNAILTFSGVAGRRVSGFINASTFERGSASLRNQNGETLATFSLLQGSFLNAQTLPATGTYTLLVDPFSEDTGSATVTLHDVPPDITGNITPDGPPIPIAITQEIVTLTIDD